MSVKPNWSKQAVGASGVRRIVPMLGVDYIAGQIQIKKKPYSGTKKASMGGRTRFWSTTNFLNISSGAQRMTPLSASELVQREQFGNSSKYASDVTKTPTTLQLVLTDFSNGTPRNGIDPADCLNLYQFVWRATYAYQAGGGTLPQQPTWPLV